MNNALRKFVIDMKIKSLQKQINALKREKKKIGNVKSVDKSKIKSELAQVKSTPNVIEVATQIP
jgi:hypothetical protein